MALVHPVWNWLTNKWRNLWVGRCVSSRWPWFLSRNSFHANIYIYCRCIPVLYSEKFRTGLLILPLTLCTGCYLGNLSLDDKIYRGWAIYLGYCFCIYLPPSLECFSPGTCLLSNEFKFVRANHFGSANTHFPDMFLLGLLLEYWIESVPMEFCYTKFIFATRIFYKSVPGFATKSFCILVPC